MSCLQFCSIPGWNFTDNPNRCCLCNPSTVKSLRRDSPYLVYGQLSQVDLQACTWGFATKPEEHNSIKFRTQTVPVILGSVKASSRDITRVLGKSNVFKNMPFLLPVDQSASEVAAIALTGVCQHSPRGFSCVAANKRPQSLLFLQKKKRKRIRKKVNSSDALHQHYCLL